MLSESDSSVTLCCLRRIYEDTAFGGVVEAREQVGCRGLAGATGPDQSHRLSGFSSEVDVL
ncbi:MAG: hypothetical protein AMJ93_03375 [Anaerolineae bacterium SM23_84]|nr:MAG: hypothetical protein AMJ93_03375 [Anaerolineae bacterium SM23_84]